MALFWPEKDLNVHQLRQDAAMKVSDLPIRNLGIGKRPWQLDLRYVGGGRKCFETRECAETARDVYRTELRRLGSSALSLSDQDKMDLVWAKGQLKPHGKTLRDAIEFFNLHHSIAEPIRTLHALEQIVSAKKATGKDAGYLRIFATNIRSFAISSGDKLLPELTRNDIEKWLFNPAWKPATINNKRIDVRTFFAYALKRHWILSNPAAHLEPVDLGDTPPGILTVFQSECLLRSSRLKRADLLPFIVLGLFCGLRPEEAVQLSHLNIQLSRNYVEVPAAVAKSRKRRIVDIPLNGREWLSVCGPISPMSIRAYNNKLMTARKWAGRNLAAFLFEHSSVFPWPHDALRHSFASYHLALHGSADRTATQMGHRSTEMLFSNYRELVLTCEAEKFFAIVP
jgi:integrase